ncbi:hypothetical protein Y032_0009g802 [Ancylostoma ceylanicum]|uniref:Uncharacterized protein n=1 Tax=Ancylostoma ceylanicum TaxID=53326 RepID=A0A016VKQ8_9BILA|nr:hypothetical protein Y032_0009g802 [Ancylostoma ceylanicum]
MCSSYQNSTRGPAIVTDFQIDKRNLMKSGTTSDQKKRHICVDTAVDTEPSVVILVSATPVNAIDLACYEWSSPIYHVVYGILLSLH